MNNNIKKYMQMAFACWIALSFSYAHGATIDYTKPITAKSLIKDGEGFKKHVYMDTTGHYTIGYGFKMNDTIQERFGHSITRTQADAYLDEILPYYQKIAQDYHKSPHSSVNAVLTDVAYNIGYKLFTFEKMASALNMGDYERASEELRDSLYCRQVQSRCTRNASILTNIKEGGRR